MNEKIFSFEAPEYLKTSRGRLWYGITGVFLLTLLISALREGSWSFAIALLTFLGVYVLLFHSHPKMLSVTLSRKGIQIGEKSFSFSEVKSFWIHEMSDAFSILHFRTHSRFAPDFRIVLSDQDPSEVREFLKQFLAEAKETEKPFSDTLTHLLKL